MTKAKPKHDPSNTVYLLKGRSIDGDCWRSGVGWADLPGLGQVFHTLAGVSGALAEAKWEYDRSSLDDTIGCLEIKTMLQGDYDKLLMDAYAIMEFQQAAWEEDQ